jgi:hypothetical protein
MMRWSWRGEDSDGSFPSMDVRFAEGRSAVWSRIVCSRLVFFDALPFAGTREGEACGRRIRHWSPAAVLTGNGVVSTAKNGDGRPGSVGGVFPPPEHVNVPRMTTTVPIRGFRCSCPPQGRFRLLVVLTLIAAWGDDDDTAVLLLWDVGPPSATAVVDAAKGRASLDANTGRPVPCWVRTVIAVTCRPGTTAEPRRIVRL